MDTSTLQQNMRHTLEGKTADKFSVLCGCFIKGQIGSQKSTYNHGNWFHTSTECTFSRLMVQYASPM